MSIPGSSTRRRAAIRRGVDPNCAPESVHCRSTNVAALDVARVLGHVSAEEARLGRRVKRSGSSLNEDNLGDIGNGCFRVFG